MTDISISDGWNTTTNIEKSYLAFTQELKTRLETTRMSMIIERNDFIWPENDQFNYVE